MRSPDDMPFTPRLDIGVPDAAIADLFAKIFERKLGEGAFRTVFAVCGNDEQIIKLEKDGGCFHNVLEHQIWQRVRETRFACWFAPCMHISPGGMWLTQMRTDPVLPRDLPDRVPAFFTDLKVSNWGRLRAGKGKGSIVCHDYGSALLMEVGMTSRLKRAVWR